MKTRTVSASPDGLALPRPRGAVARDSAKVLAKVNGAEITDDDVRIALEDLGPTLPPAAEGAGARRLCARLPDRPEARGRARPPRTSCGDTPDFARQMAYYHDKMLMEGVLTNVAKTAATDEAEQKVYDDAAKAAEAGDGDPRPPHPGADRGRGQGGAGAGQGRRGFRQGGRRGVQGPGLAGRRPRLVHQGQDGAGIRRRGLQARAGPGLRAR